MSVIQCLLAAVKDGKVDSKEAQIVLDYMDKIQKTLEDRVTSGELDAKAAYKTGRDLLNSLNGLDDRLQEQFKNLTKARRVTEKTLGSLDLNYGVAARRSVTTDLARKEILKNISKDGDMYKINEYFAEGTQKAMYAKANKFGMPAKDALLSMKPNFWTMTKVAQEKAIFDGFYGKATPEVEALVNGMKKSLEMINHDRHAIGEIFTDPKDVRLPAFVDMSKVRGERNLMTLANDALRGRKRVEILQQNESKFIKLISDGVDQDYLLKQYPELKGDPIEVTARDLFRKLTGRNTEQRIDAKRIMDAISFKDSASASAFREAFGGDSLYSDFLSYINDKAKTAAFRERFGYSFSDFIKGHFEDEKFSKHANHLATFWAGTYEKSDPGFGVTAIRNIKAALSPSLLLKVPIQAAVMDPLNAGFTAYAQRGALEGMREFFGSMFAPLHYKDIRLKAQTVMTSMDFFNMEAQNYLRGFESGVPAKWLSKYGKVMVGKLGFLDAITEAHRSYAVFQQGAYLAQLVDEGTKFDALPEIVKRDFGTFGITKKMWESLTPDHILRMDDYSVISPDFLQTQGNKSLTKLGERLAGFIELNKERSVITSSATAQARRAKGLAAGQLVSAGVELGTTFMSYVTSMWFNHYKRIWNAADATFPGKASALKDILAYTGAMITLGAVYEEMKSLVKNQDPIPLRNTNLWKSSILNNLPVPFLSAFTQTEGFNFFGPVQSAAEDAAGIGKQLFKGQFSKAGAAGAKFAANLIPRTFYTNFIVQQVIDYITKITDPEAYKKFNRAKNNAKKFNDTQYFIKPGDPSSARLPDFNNLLK